MSTSSTTSIARGPVVVPNQRPLNIDGDEALAVAAGTVCPAACPTQTFAPVPKHIAAIQAEAKHAKKRGFIVCPPRCAPRTAAVTET